VSSIKTNFAGLSVLTIITKSGICATIGPPTNKVGKDGHLVNLVLLDGHQ
jgi:hypothetical protein